MKHFSCAAPRGVTLYPCRGNGAFPVGATSQVRGEEEGENDGAAWRGGEPQASATFTARDRQPV